MTTHKYDRTTPFKTLLAKANDLDLVLEPILEKTLADFIREHASAFIDMDQKKPTIWQQMRETGATKDLACATAVAISFVCLFAVVFRQYSRLYIIASIAGVIGACLGWAGRQLWKWITAPRTGWIEDLLDSAGREHLIVWKRFDRGFTDADIKSVRNVGDKFAAHNREMNQTNEHIGFTSMETIDNGIGVRLIGHNAENMLRVIRPFFQLHFPRGAFVTRSRRWWPDEDRKSPELNWKQPQPLFEGDEIIPPWWLSVYMDSEATSDSRSEEH